MRIEYSILNMQFEEAAEAAALNIEYSGNHDEQL